MDEAVTYFAPTAGDTEALSAMARTAFVDTFSAKFHPVGMQRYLAAAYGDGGEMACDLADPSVRWQAARRGKAILGYIKMTPLRLDIPAATPGASELRQLYVMPAAKGQRIADALTDWGLQVARDAEARELYLAVFEDNHRAKAFYARRGFLDIAPCTFSLGDLVYEDRILRRAL